MATDSDPNAAGEPEQPPPLRELDVIKTYRYLRIGLFGAVVLLAASIAIERSKVDCWQTSISAYYYTPARAIFVGCLMTVGLSLIVYKGRTIVEDACLNAAGAAAPLVAVAPTTDVGTCWSVAPSPRPVDDDGTTLANWVVTNIDNNVDALLITGSLGLLVAILIAVVANKGDVQAPARAFDRATCLSLFGAAVGLLVIWWLSRSWDDFDTRAHGLAAILMFGFLIGAIAANAWGHRAQRNSVWFRSYAGVAVTMFVGGILIAATRIFGDHTVFALEACEITLFAIYWAIQTKEKWPEQVA